MTLDEFVDKVCARPLPQDPMARVRTLAKELAEGGVNDHQANDSCCSTASASHQNKPES